MRVTVKTSSNKLDHQTIARELRLLRSFMIGLAGRDPEGNYRPEFVERILKAADEPVIHKFTGTASFLKLLKRHDNLAKTL